MRGPAPYGKGDERLSDLAPGTVFKGTSKDADRKPLTGTFTDPSLLIATKWKRVKYPTRGQLIRKSPLVTSESMGLTASSPER